ncbi:hypothetical protein RJ639_041367 [Escallonia herrerae]|uniref:URB1 N-terminal domain-containing protein n=1 Tax=Escallonia herrerae TaxID=1293975 RepID=A0AA88WGV9_9ASTE|nr:hypothetical protein RJ639_041367 [Escallonia herrerae]
MEVESETEFRESNFPTAVIEVPRGAKLKEILRNVTSFDLKFCSDASKEFIKLLKTDAGGEFLREYVKSSSNCAELLQAWKLRQGKSGLLYIFRLVASILSHPVGKYKANSVEDIGLSRALDKFARLIIEEKLGDVYEELNSKEVKRQNAALLVLGSVVRRGSVLASEVAKSFDFKLPIFPKLAEYNVRRGVESKRKHSTRRAFVGFAMSFLEVGKPGLLRWVLQQRDMFSVVLRGLGSDDDETVCYVLSTLRDRILVPESLVPPGLRSVIFGSVTLDQLISIAGRENGGLGTEVAFKVLGMVCTDPSNGLMPDPKRHPNPLRGNQKRLLDLMKKLKATEIRYHRELLLSIVNGSALFGSAYLDEFPYNLEDHASPTWFAAVSLAANLVSSVRAGYPFGFLENQTEEPPSINSSDVQGIIRCISPRPFSRLVINKGLLHSDSVVKQGTLRLVLEALMLLDSFIGILNNCARSSSQMSHIWASLKQDIQNEIRILLPDPQVLLSLLSPLNLRYKSPNSRLKRVAASEIVLEENMNRTKKKRTHSENEATDIVVCGITSSPDVPLPGDGIGVQENAGDLEIKDDCVKAYLELWGLHQCMAVEDEETYFYSKLLDTLKIYHIRDIKDQAYILAEAAMLSTGAFETNSREIGAWFLFLPGYSSCNNIVEHGVEIIQNLSSVVVSFLCDAVSTTGNNLFKYWDLLRCHIHRLEGDEDVSPDFSPLMVCVLEKCLRLLSSDSGTFTLPEKAMISLYVSNTLRYILQTQVEAGLLSSLISLLLSEGLDGHCSSVDIHGDFCEWRPLENLLLFSNSILDKQTCSILSDDTKVVHADSSFYHTLSEVKNFVGRGYDDILPGITTAFVYSMLCTEPAAIAKNFPSVVSISHSLHGVPIPHLFSIVSLEQNLLKDVSKLWPGMFFTGVERVVTMIHGEGRVEELTVKLDMDSIGSATVAFCSFLERAPFYVLFPALLSVGYSYVLEISKLQDLLLTKLSEGATDLISSLRLLLFWFYKIESSYRDKPLDELEQLSEMCFTLMDKMLARLFVEKTDSGFSTITSAPLSTHYLQEVAETLFCHPAVIMTLECPLSRSEEFSDAILGESWENFLALARRGVHKNDYCVFDMLAKTSDYVFALCNDHKIPSEVDCANKRIVKAFESLVQKLFGILKERFDHCTNTNLFLPLIPTLFALYTLSRFISPFELLELVQWIFSKADLKDSTSNYSALAIGLGIAGCAFDLLSAYVQQPGTELTAFVSWGIEGKSFDVTLFENIYFRVADIASRVELDVADICFLKVVNGFSRHRLLQNKCLPLCVVMSRLIASTPVRFLSHCLQRTSITKAQLIFRLTEVSPLHLAIFGHLFSDMTSGTFLRKCNMVQGYSSTLADDDFLLLLPTALSYLKSNLVKYGKQFYNCFRKIPSFYWTILVHGFSNWKSFVSREIFRVEFNEYLLSSEEELLNFFHRSLLGTSILMARYYFALCGGSWKQKKCLKLFDSVCSSSGVNEDLLDCDVGNISAYSPNQCLNFTMKALAKISLCRMLLFPEDNLIQFLPKDGNGDPVGVTSEVGSSKAFSSRSRFVEALVHTWQSVVKKVPSNPFGSRKVECTNYSLFRYLEVFILRNISEITAEMHDSGMQSDSLPYIEQLARYTLLYRFEVPGILSMLCNVLALVPEGTFSHSLVLQLLIAHSQFAPTIQSASCSSGSLQFGMIFKPMSSILKSLVLHGKDDYALCKEDNPQMPKQLEVVKLLRVLFHFTAQQCGFDSEEDNGINCKELLFLLMSSYGATMSEIDVEIYYLMHEIECISESNPAYVAEIDYLWGSAAVKVRKEREMEQDISVDNTNDETVEERRRIQFRENLPVDPKMCANTVLHFPYYRTTGEGFLSSNKLPRGDAECMTKVFL